MRLASISGGPRAAPRWQRSQEAPGATRAARAGRLGTQTAPVRPAPPPACGLPPCGRARGRRGPLLAAHLDVVAYIAAEQERARARDEQVRHPQPEQGGAQGDEQQQPEGAVQHAAGRGEVVLGLQRVGDLEPRARPAEGAGPPGSRGPRAQAAAACRGPSIPLWRAGGGAARAGRAQSLDLDPKPRAPPRAPPQGGAAPSHRPRTSARHTAAVSTTAKTTVGVS
jgi:hypothetical protein